MKKRIAVLVLIVAALTAGILFLVLSGDDRRDILRVSGNIEATDVQLSFKIPGRLEKRLVSEGDAVTKGQLVAQLDNDDEILSVEQARAAVNYSRSILQELQRGSRSQEIEAARAEVNRALAGLQTAEAQLELARADFERFSKLHEQGVISLRELDEHRTRYSVAQSAHKEAAARARGAREQLSLVQEGPRKEKREQAQSQLQNAEQALKKAELNLSYTTLVSPMNAVVLKTSAEAGEYLNPGTPVTTDTYPGKVYKGRISFISSEAEFTPKSVQTEEERVKLVYRIKIALENQGRELKPGMPADAMIRLNSR